MEYMPLLIMGILRTCWDMSGRYTDITGEGSARRTYRLIAG